MSGSGEANEAGLSRLDTPPPSSHLLGSDPVDIERQADYLLACADVIMDSGKSGRLEAKVAMERTARKLVSLSAELRAFIGTKEVIDQLYEILRASDDDDICKVARQRMAEIKEIEQEFDAPAPSPHVVVNKYVPDFRKLAVEIVDGIRGYTFEFSSHPAAHKDDYDFIEEKLRAALATATEGSGE